MIYDPTILGIMPSDSRGIIPVVGSVLGSNLRFDKWYLGTMEIEGKYGIVGLTPQKILLDFLAEVTQHIPNKGEHLIRYYGWPGAP